MNEEEVEEVEDSGVSSMGPDADSGPSVVEVGEGSSAAVFLAPRASSRKRPVRGKVLVIYYLFSHY